MIVRFGVGQGGDGVFGDDQDVDGRLGIDVSEGEGEVVFVDDVGGNLAPDDFAKEGVTHGERFLKVKGFQGVTLAAEILPYSR